MDRIKLWSVTVNNWGWDKPKTIYGLCREDCEKIASEYPAADPVRYAGMYTKEKAMAMVTEV